MKTRFRIPSMVVLLAVAFFALVGGEHGPFGDVRQAQARDNPLPKELQHVGVTEHLDGQLPLDAVFRDQNNQMVKLGDYYGRRPVLLIMAYHSCPVLCGMVQNATATALKQVPWTVNKEFDVVVISIDPKDPVERAAAKRTAIVNEYGRPNSEAGFHFLLGDKTQIDRVATATGFEYEYDERQGQYAHPAVIMLTKMNGQMARYLYGLEYQPSDIRIGLLEAANNRSISTVERVILYCYHYDPQDGKYVLLATRVMRLGGALTVLCLGTLLGVLWARERKKSRELNKNTDKSATPLEPATETT
jgi:protein SCO1/2